MRYYNKLRSTRIYICAVYSVFFFFVATLVSFLTISRNYTKDATKNASVLQTEFDNTLKSTKAYTNILSDNEYIQAYCHESEPDFANRINATNFMQNASASLLPEKSKIAISRYSGNGILSSAPESDYYSYTKSLGISVFQADSIKNRFADNPSANIQYVFSNSANVQYLTLVVKTSPDNHNDSPFYLLISYPIADMFNIERGSDFSVGFSQGTRLLFVSSSSDEVLLKKFINNHSESKKIISSQAHYFSDSGFEISCHIVLNKSGLFVKFIPYLLIIFLIATVIFAVGFYFSLYESKKLYEPVKKLLNIADADDTVSDEFEYISKKYSTLSSGSALTDQFKSAAKDKFVTDLLFGTYTVEDFSEQLKYFGISESVEAHIAVIILKYKNFDADMSESARIRFDKLRSSVTSCLYDTFESNSLFLLSTTALNNHIIVTECPDLSELKELLQTLLLDLSEALNAKFSAIVGTPVNSIRDIHISFNSATDLLQQQSFSLFESTVITSENSEVFNKNYVSYPPELEAKLISAVMTSNPEQVRDIINRIFLYNMVPSADCFSQLITMLYATIQRLLFNTNLTEKAVFGEDVSVYLDFKACKTPNSLKRKYAATLNTMMNKIAAEQKRQDIPRSADMKKYIDDNFAKDISLTDLAEHLNMSQAHASRVFKQEMGQNFKEYLMFKRYQKATELIKSDPNIKLKDVAIQVGCPNQKALSRLMKKFESEEQNSSSAQE